MQNALMHHQVQVIRS